MEITQITHSLPPIEDEQARADALSELLDVKNVQHLIDGLWASISNVEAHIERLEESLPRSSDREATKSTISQGRRERDHLVRLKALLYVVESGPEPDEDED